MEACMACQRALCKGERDTRCVVMYKEKKNEKNDMDKLWQQF